MSFLEKMKSRYTVKKYNPEVKINDEFAVKLQLFYTTLMDHNS